MSTLYPIADSYFNSAIGNQGSGVYLAIGRIFLFSGYLSNRAVLRFDLRDYDTYHIDRCRLLLSIYNNQLFLPNAPHLVSAYAVTTVTPGGGDVVDSIIWTEADVTWTKADSDTDWLTAGGDYEATASATATVNPGDTSVELDLLTLARRKAGGYMDILLRLTDANGNTATNNHYALFNSKEGADQSLWPVIDMISFACLSIDDQAVTNLSIGDASLTNLTIGHAGCGS